MSERMVINSPAALVAAVPYLLGYRPAESLVCLAYDGTGRSCVLRHDLAGAGGELAEIVVRNEFDRVCLVGYGAEEPVRAAVSAVLEPLRARDIEVSDILRVSGGRWWAVYCDDPACCPPDGHPCDDDRRIAATAVYSGLVAMDDREALAATLAPVEGPARLAVAAATRRAERRALGWTSGADRALHVRLRQEAIPELVTVLERTRHTGDPPSDEEVGRLSVLLGHTRVRDEAWVRIDVDDTAADIRFWRDLLRRSEARYRAAPAALLAYAAYVGGDGVLANLALDRAEEADPGYVMAQLLRQVVVLGVPPDRARLSMTSEDLADLDYRKETG